MTPPLKGAKQCKQFVKGVHRLLKRNAKTRSSLEVWKRYLKDEKSIKEYAESMCELATVHWSAKSEVTPDQDRHVWIVNKLDIYRTTEELARIRRLETYFVNSRVPDAVPFEYPQAPSPERRLRCLDVGSCYNPLSEIDYLDTLAVDIGPADPTVLKCDFVTCEVADELAMDNGRITALPRDSYDVVVCSLFLDFVPSKILRRDCCQKLVKLIKTEGVLFIVCPDSLVTTRGTKDMVESWRLGLGLLGFSRVYYEKLLHFQCMAFRKVPIDQAVWKKFILNYLNQGKEVCEIEHLFRTPMDDNTD